MTDVGDQTEYRSNFEDGFFAALDGTELNDDCTSPEAWTSGFRHGQRVRLLVNEADAKT